ncbi:hypothetical protein SARC_13103 [Sphaeroforma arctica JP610]|uniref:C2 domain-containing protein n=1 Tax=Sphaeroforma arctica JP610 TaxID=667725 RepID=A0A0L0FCY6_9EUKA|nr:hypothetical protein SARC_13103 [Sphaeroforma arctica JP610]KNC74346.1 hypothetical protein SARC_13103 [Sphaeroforma arctica JP610]|eukprot:XP_014148248.1 hypothetical protein SARC_13103 [Sphaeroforma arctica JP610]
MEVVGKQHSNSRKAASHNHSHENIRAAPPLMKWVTFIVKAGESLPIGDANGLSDPYVTIDLGKKRIVKTSVKFKTLDPEWNEEYHVQVDLNDPAQEFVVCVKDKDFIGIDKLCYMTLPLKKLRQEGSVEGWHYLTKKAHLIAEIGMDLKQEIPHKEDCFTSRYVCGCIISQRRMCATVRYAYVIHKGK